MNEHEKHALIKKPHMREHMLYYSLYMKYIEKAKTREAEQKAEKQSLRTKSRYGDLLWTLEGGIWGGDGTVLKLNMVMVV